MLFAPKLKLIVKNKTFYPIKKSRSADSMIYRSLTRFMLLIVSHVWKLYKYDSI